MPENAGGKKIMRKNFREQKNYSNFAVAKATGCSTVGSAPRSGRGGRKFESSHPD